MTRQLHDAITEWLRNERRGEASAAEASLAKVVQALPEVGPGGGFRRRVVEAVGLPAVVETPLAPRWGGRLALAFALTFAAVGLKLPALRQAFDLEGVVLGAARLGISIVDLARYGAAFWQILGDVGHAFVVAARTPHFLALAAIGTLVAVLAARLLVGLASHDWRLHAG